ncbi:hypothetical protein B0T24DRAFT_706756 [Lasiosphaeria ovina]|uniref:Uncharacterized protein n=1 Tax=Lasiosphaeria ovina TaxID=92902 RepID=A0AAE0K7X0_9PEZI|nr:hypothetical protein B0T24DRAFT_706756 [Lasiosphaeria ovina]
MPEFSEAFVACIAQALRTAQVPNVLWGHCLLNVHGVPSVIMSVDFVVRDDCLDVGAEAIGHVKGVAPCPDPAACPSSSPTRPTPPPSFHVHCEDSELVAGLYLQSDTLVFLPPLDHSLLHPTKLELPPHFVLASDQAVLPPWRPGRGTGLFKSSRDLIVVPKSHILLEAYMRLYARDFGKPVGNFGMAMICYLEGYVDLDGLLDIQQLPGPLKTLYVELRDGRKPVRQWTNELRDALALPELNRFQFEKC